MGPDSRCFPTCYVHLLLPCPPRATRVQMGCPWKSARALVPHDVPLPLPQMVRGSPHGYVLGYPAACLRHSLRCSVPTASGRQDRTPR